MYNIYYEKFKHSGMVPWTGNRPISRPVHLHRTA